MMIKCVLAGVQLSEKTFQNLIDFIENEKSKAFEEGRKSVSRGRPRKERTPEELELLKIRQQLKDQGLIKRGWVKGRPRKDWTPEELEARKEQERLREQGLIKRGWAKGRKRKNWNEEDLKKKEISEQMRQKRKEFVKEGLIKRTGWPLGKPRGTRAEREEAKSLGISVEELRSSRAS